MDGTPRVRRTERRAAQAQTSQEQTDFQQTPHAPIPERPREMRQPATRAMDRPAPPRVRPASPSCPAHPRRPAPKPKKKKRWWIWVIAAVLVVGALSTLEEKPPETRAAMVAFTDAPIFTDTPTSAPVAKEPASTIAPDPAASPAQAQNLAEVVALAPSDAPTSKPTEEPAPSPAPTSQYKTLKIKAKGAEVQAMQDALVELGYLRKKDAIGEFGNNTLDAVKRFQAANGLDVDGVAGAGTLELLFSGNAVTAEPVIYVWTATSGGGQKYHSSSTCSRMKKAQEMTLEKAKELGFTPCDTCKPPR